MTIPHVHYTPGEEMAHYLTHGTGIVASVLAIPLLAWTAVRHGDAWRLAGGVIFGLSALLLFTTSVLYHSASDPPRRMLLRRFDHAAIYLLIAGTYTPFTLVGLRGDVGRNLFIAIWSLAAAGIVFKLFFTGRFRLLSTGVYVAMGWLVLLAIRPVMAALDGWTFGWLIAGGVAYTLGTVFYHRPSMRYSHAVWHLFVVAGTVCHYVAVLAQVWPRD